MNEVAIISTFPPTYCGIASYAQDMLDALKSQKINNRYIQFRLVSEYDYNWMETEKCIIIRENNKGDFLRAARIINQSNISLVNIQHEFKIYGPPDGENIIDFIDNLKKPIILTLHTIWYRFNEIRTRVLLKVIDKSWKIFVFTNESKEILTSQYNCPADKIKVIPHPIPNIEFTPPTSSKLRKEFNAKFLFISAGYIRNSKGYDVALKAFSIIKKTTPNFKYLILGLNHPKDKTSINYRNQLTELVHSENLHDNVIFKDKYLSTADMIEYIKASDCGITPYQRAEQSSSGILALFVACGRPIISTPYHFAKSILLSAKGYISEDFNFGSIKHSIEKFCFDPIEIKEKMMLENFCLGQQWKWSQIAKEYIKVEYLLSQSEN